MKHRYPAIILLCLLFLVGCQETAYPDCQVSSLLLDASLFPEVTEEGKIVSPVSYSSDNSAGSTFYTKTDRIMVTVSGFSSDREANSHYKGFVETSFDNDGLNGPNGPWETPEIDFTSEWAQRYEYKCGPDEDEYLCILVTQYHQYVVWLRMTLTTNGLSLEDFEKAMRASDEQMGACISGELEK